MDATRKKKARDGTLRGRPPLFGRAGDYERVYAEVGKATAARLKEDARRTGCSVSHLLCEIAAAHRPESFRRRPPVFEAPGPGERVYAQVPAEVHERLRGEAHAHGWALSRLLAAIVDEHYSEAAAGAAT